VGAGSHKRAADSELDAFLGLKPRGGGSSRQGNGPAGGAQQQQQQQQQQQSLGDIERMLLQAAPQDLSEAVKPKKKHKNKGGK
jgi:hypothetical protein